MWILIGIAAFTVLKCVRRMVHSYWYSGPACLATKIHIPRLHYLYEDGIDWSQFAYAQYATNSEYLCNAVMLFETLHRLDSKADRLLMYPAYFDNFDVDGISTESKLLQKAKKEYGVNLVPIEVQHKKSSYYMWSDSYTKLLAFNQTQYSRVLILDSDSTILQPMDELFFVPPTAAALPRAYWLDEPKLASHIMVIQPSEDNFKRVQKATKEASGNVYDMEIVNDLFGDSCVVLPHSRYGLLTGELRHPKHTLFLYENQRWDPEKVIAEAKFVHFSDDPFPKPWLKATERMINWARPQCIVNGAERDGCKERDIWLNLYKDFQERRKRVCGLDQSKLE